MENKRPAERKMEVDDFAAPPASSSRNDCLDRLETLDRFRRGNVLCDVVLVVEDHEFAAHRNVLAASSPYFYSLFTTDMKEQAASRIALPELKLSAMNALLCYLYTGRVDDKEANAEELVESASYLLLPRLKQIACTILQRSATPANCVCLYAFADKYDCVELRDYAQKLMKQHFANSSVGMSTCLQTLSVEQIEELVSSDWIVVNAEEEVLDAVLAWIRADEASRAKYLTRLFEHVRLGSISDYYFHTTLTSNPVIISSGECMERVLEAVRWRVLHSREQLPREKPRACLETHVDGVIACGGLSPEGQVSESAWCYVPADRSWRQLASMHAKRCRHGFLACREFLYAIGGKGEEYFHQTVERYDPRTNTWTHVAPMPTKVVCSDGAARNNL